MSELQTADVTVETTIDQSAQRLHANGWSAGELAYRLAGQLVWQVYASKGEARVLARANSQSAAWAEAARLAAAL